MRVRVVTDEKATSAKPLLRSERIEAERILMGRVVDCVPPMRQENATSGIPTREQAAATEMRLVLGKE